MATKYYLGTSQPVAQVTTVTVGGTLAGETFQLLVGGVVIAEHTDTTTVIADTIAALVAAWNASTHPWATRVTAAAASPDMTLTADTAGVPFVITLNTPGGAATFAQAATQANKGPNDWSDGDNWYDAGAGTKGAVPANTDTVIIADLDTNICWGLNQNAVTVAELITRNSRSRIGLPRSSFAISADGATVDNTIEEYRQAYLRIGYDSASLGIHSGPGTVRASARIKLDNSKAGASTTTIFNTATTSADLGLPAVMLLLAHASADPYIRSAPGGVGIAVGPGETSTCGIVRISDPTLGSRVSTGAGLTFASWDQLGGISEVRAAATVTQVKVTGGRLTTEGDFTLNTLISNGGECFPNHIKTGGSAIALVIMSKGIVDARQSLRARTWDALTMDKGARLLYDGAVLTITLLTTAAAEAVTVTVS